MDSIWIILTGSFVAVSCALLGSFLVLRKMSMVGDAISHAVLPGLVIAYLVSGSRASVPMLIGAALVGMLTTFLIELLHKKFRLQSDASIGITFTALFALGIVLISVFAGKVDLDQDCVLHGEIAYVPFELWITPSGVNLGPISLWITGVCSLLILLFVTLGFKGLKITTFDETYAQSLGISAAFWHYALMAAVSLTTVVSFEVVGAILVVAFFIIPAATAYLLTNKLVKMLLLACIFGVLSCFLGYLAAQQVDTSITGAMVSVSGAMFLGTLVFKLFSAKQKSHSFEKLNLK